MNLNPQTHPTVQALGLRVYVSKYDNTRCIFCSEPVKVGDVLAMLPEDFRQKLLRLREVNVKTFKYAHVSCLPISLPQEIVDAIRPVAAMLAGLTDPAWPKDEVGFSAGDASPCMAWLDTGAPAIGAWSVALRLQRYYHTQLSEEQVANVRAAVLAGYELRRQWKPDLKHPEGGGKGGGNGGAEASASSTTSTAAAAPVAPTQVAPPMKVPPVQIDAGTNPAYFTVKLEAPWVCAAHATIKDKVKALGARFDGTSKLWVVKGEALARAWETLWGTVPVQLTTKAAEAFKAFATRATLSIAKDESGVDDALTARIKAVVPDGRQLYPFQVSGVGYLEASKGRALIGDDMGLGKSAQALIYLALHPELRPAVLVVPAIVATNWLREAAMWSPSDVTYRVRNGKDTIPTNATLIVVTYDLLKKRAEELKQRNPKLVLSDECHYLKEWKTARTKCFVDFVKLPSVKAVIALSGTPVVNRPKEFYTILQILRPWQFGNWMQFTGRYCDGEQTKFGYVCNGATNTDELAHRLRDVMVRRTKDEVLTELPPKVRETIDVDLTAAQMKAYEHTLDDVARNAEDKGRELVIINAARQLVGAHKAAVAIDWIEEYNNQSKPLLVFAHHNEVLNIMERGCQEKHITYGRIDGGVSPDKRGQLVDDFQAGKINVMLISMKAGGVGITLTKAQDVLFVERAWTPGDEVQAEDRAHRIGQKGSVLVRYLKVAGTVDEKMAELIESKRSVLAALLDGATPEKLSIQAELMAWVTERYRKNERK